MKPGELVQTFCDPFREQGMSLEAKLITKIKNIHSLQLWEVEYTDHPNHTYEMLIKPKAIYTCESCEGGKDCEFYMDDYNTNGDCLAMK